jgi:hypothetical protein
MTGTIYVRFRIVAHFIYILEKINSLRMALTHLPAFYLIAAMSENHVIGINNRLPESNRRKSISDGQNKLRSAGCPAFVIQKHRAYES